MDKTNERGYLMDETMVDVKDELVQIQTIQVLLDDKLHKFQEILTRLDVRIDALEKEIK